MKTVAVFGLGDIGQRLALFLAEVRPKIKLLLIGRDSIKGKQMADLVATCFGQQVDFVLVDGLCMASIRKFLREAQPDIIIQAASLISPWAAFDSNSPILKAFRSAGFAANLSAQIPIILNLMRAIETEKTTCVTINCSYPDVTNSILKKIGKAPDIGIGNVGMIRRLLTLKNPDLDDKLRVFAHHSQIWLFLRGEKSSIPVRIYQGAKDVSDTFQSHNFCIPTSKKLNALAASHALEILLSYLMVGGKETKSSAPGICGLPGGWPIRMANGRVKLDMPQGISVDQMLLYQQEAGKLEGIDEISSDGTVYFTDKLKRTLPAPFRDLGNPLRPDDALKRASFLRGLIYSNK
jgi:hypothetical protein